MPILRELNSGILTRSQGAPKDFFNSSFSLPIMPKRGRGLILKFRVILNRPRVGR